MGRTFNFPPISIKFHASELSEAKMCVLMQQPVHHGPVVRIFMSCPVISIDHPLGAVSAVYLSPI